MSLTTGMQNYDPRVKESKGGEPHNRPSTYWTGVQEAERSWTLTTSESGGTRIRMQVLSRPAMMGPTWSAEHCPIHCHDLLEATCKEK